MAIIEVEVALAMVVTFIDHMVMEEAITEAITIINIINITRMMMDPSLKNMVQHAPFAEVSIILLNIVLREKMTSIILWRKLALALTTNTKMVYINKGDHDNPHGIPKDNLEGSQDIVHHDYAHIDISPKMPEEIKKLEYIYQHFQDHKKVYEFDPQVMTEPIHDTLYPQMNNNIEYGLFEHVIDSYYLDSQIRDDFQCTKTCYTHNTTASTLYQNPPCTHIHDHISQQLNS